MSIYYRAEFLEATRTFVKKMSRDFINDMRGLDRNLLRKLISELIDHSRKYHNIIMLFLCHPKILLEHCFQFLSGPLKLPRETEDNAYAKFSGVTNKDHYGMLWYFLEWSIQSYCSLRGRRLKGKGKGVFRPGEF